MREREKESVHAIYYTKNPLICMSVIMYQDISVRGRVQCVCLCACACVCVRVL